MKKFCLGAFLLIPALTIVALGAENGKNAEGRVARRSVVVPQDTTPFKVATRQRVRLTGEGIAGSKIVADVDGPARIVAENSIVTVKDGHILVGMAKVEFDIRPTGQGTVKVKITTTPPQPNAEPAIKIYEFEVK